MAPKSTFVLSESPFWPKLPLSCGSFGAERIMISNGSLMSLSNFRYLVFPFSDAQQIFVPLHQPKYSLQIRNKKHKNFENY